MKRTASFLVAVAGALLLTAQPAGADERPARDRYRIDLLTIGQGDRAFEMFAHNALLLVDLESGKKAIYNYGTFDDASLGAVATFLQGRLEFYLYSDDWETVAHYYAGRDVFTQELDLPRGAADLMAEWLTENAQLANRRYIYDHFRDNCSTRVRDQLDRALGGLIQKQVGSLRGQGTYRSNLDAWLGPTPWTRVILHFIWANHMDDPITRREEMFLPYALRQAVSEITVGHPDGSHRPLVAREVKLQSRVVPRPVRPLWPVALTLAATLLPLAVGAVIAWRRARGIPWVGPSRLAEVMSGVALMLYGLVGGLAGLLIAAIWLTRVVDGHANGNLCYVSPLQLALLPIGLSLALGRLRARTARWASYLLAINLALIATDLLVHAVGLGRQQHTLFALYFGPAAFLAWMSLRARALALSSRPAR